MSIFNSVNSSVKYTTSNLSYYLQKNLSFFCIDGERRKALCFRERLDVYPKHHDESGNEPKPIGSYGISVEKSGPMGHDLLVHVFSSMTINGCNGGSRLISSATGELHCLEEKRNEFIKSDKDATEKNLFVNVREEAYYVRIKQKLACGVKRSCFEIPYNNDCNFISDGCIVVLMRYLAMMDFSGTLCFDVVTIDGVIAICEFECLSAEPMEMNGFTVDVYTLTQRLFVNENLTCENKYLLTCRGKILSVDWTHTDFILKINPFLDPEICDLDPVIAPLRDTWRDDLELMSKYLDRKTYEIARQEEYLALHSEVNYLIADYIQTLLCRKPTDVLSFTINYFRTFKTCELSESSESFYSEECKFSETESVEILSDEQPAIPCVSIDDTLSALNSQCKEENETSLILNCSSCTLSSSNNLEKICDEAKSSMDRKSCDCSISEIKSVCEADNEVNNSEVESCVCNINNETDGCEEREENDEKNIDSDVKCYDSKTILICTDDNVASGVKSSDSKAIIICNINNGTDNCEECDDKNNKENLASDVKSCNSKVTICNINNGTDNCEECNDKNNKENLASDAKSCNSKVTIKEEIV